MAPLVEEIKKQDIVDQLTWDDSVNANEVHVDVKDGTVQLSGSVESFAGKIAAEKDAYQVAGVKYVENNLDVRYPADITVPDDVEITSNINRMLLWNSNINSSNIEVETNNRIVTLKGSVESYWEKFLAEDIANTAFGVAGIINLLEVTLTKSIVDIDIENDIKSAYRRSFFIDENRITVMVNNGTVTLRGTVPTYLVKKEALDIAKYTSGVVDIIDEITIE
jgi:osmotically-inducible protein OsmY